MRLSLWALVFAGGLGCDAVAEDGALLSELSRDEFVGLCDELRDAVPGPDTPISCADGWSATVYTPTNSECRFSYIEQCRATAGDVRACAEAVRRDPCAAVEREPAECGPLYAGGCSPESTASPVEGRCPSIDPQALGALEGVYELTRHTRRSSSCEPGGDSVLELDSERLLVLVATQNVDGEPIGRLQSCIDVATCRDAAANLRNQTLPAEGTVELFLDLDCAEGNAVGFWTRQFLALPTSDDTCPFVDAKTVLSRAPDGSLRVDTETWELSLPIATNGCFFYRGDRRASTGHCTGIEMREAHFLLAL
jgi:hypothetical protein